MVGWVYEHLMWRWTAGRPWTYAIRDWTSRHPEWALLVALPVTAALVVGQVVSVSYLGWWALPAVLFADFMAVTAGHLFWDTRGPYVQPKTRFKTEPGTRSPPS